MAQVLRHGRGICFHDLAASSSFPWGSSLQVRFPQLGSSWQTLPHRLQGPEGRFPKLFLWPRNGLGQLDRIVLALKVLSLTCLEAPVLSAKMHDQRLQTNWLGCFELGSPCSALIQGGRMRFVILQQLSGP
mmetsp:Transcript_44597/g.118974  ORF Transcript_44597/g.118974 Transcript_44597/m.118974 type:complete len:131 (+) Transcript_44597:268-660(+)